MSAELADWLVYHRDAVFDGQIWRLWSSQLTHLDSRHGADNLLAAIAVLLVARIRSMDLGYLALVSFVIATLLALGLLVMPWVKWYLGASGVLYGLAVYLAGSHHRSTAGFVMAALGLYIALTIEHQTLVLAEAHILGALSGLVLLKILPPRYCSGFANRLEFAPFRRKVAAFLWAPKSLTN